MRDIHTDDDSMPSIKAANVACIVIQVPTFFAMGSDMRDPLH